MRLDTGDFLAFHDHDELLTPNATGEGALHLAEHFDVDVLHSDDDKIDWDGMIRSSIRIVVGVALTQSGEVRGAIQKGTITQTRAAELTV